MNNYRLFKAHYRESEPFGSYRMVTEYYCIVRAPSSSEAYDQVLDVYSDTLEDYWDVVEIDMTEEGFAFSIDLSK